MVILKEDGQTSNATLQYFFLFLHIKIHYALFGGGNNEENSKINTTCGNIFNILMLCVGRCV